MSEITRRATLKGMAVTGAALPPASMPESPAVAAIQNLALVGDRIPH
ncbi:hypothetical protein [Nonomuraea sp. NPDC050643]